MTFKFIEVFMKPVLRLALIYIMALRGWVLIFLLWCLYLWIIFKEISMGYLQAKSRSLWDQNEVIDMKMDREPLVKNKNGLKWENLVVFRVINCKGSGIDLKKKSMRVNQSEKAYFRKCITTQSFRMNLATVVLLSTLFCVS